MPSNDGKSSVAVGSQAKGCRLQPLTQEEAALRIQRIGRGMIARRRVAREAEAEEVFIGMRLAVSHRQPCPGPGPCDPPAHPPTHPHTSLHFPAGQGTLESSCPKPQDNVIQAMIACWRALMFWHS